MTQLKLINHNLDPIMDDPFCFELGCDKGAVFLSDGRGCCCEEHNIFHDVKQIC